MVEAWKTSKDQGIREYIFANEVPTVYKIDNCVLSFNLKTKKATDVTALNSIC